MEIIYQEIKSNRTTDGTINLKLTPAEFAELQYALETLNKKRELSRQCSRKKSGNIDDDGEFKPKSKNPYRTRTIYTLADPVTSSP